MFPELRERRAPALPIHLSNLIPVTLVFVNRGGIVISIGNINKKLLTVNINKESLTSHRNKISYCL